MSEPTGAPPQAPGTALVKVPETYSIKGLLDEWQGMQTVAATLVKSGFLPRGIDTAEKCLAVLMVARELRLPPMRAMSGLYVVHGKVEMDGNMMLSLIRERCPGAWIRFDERTAEKCVITTKRPGQPQATFTYTMAEAVAAKLHVRWDKDLRKEVPQEAWQKNPRVMVCWKCVGEMSRFYYGDIVGGAFAPGELPDGMLKEADFEVSPPDPSAEKAAAEIVQPKSGSGSESPTAKVGGPSPDGGTGDAVAPGRPGPADSPPEEGEPEPEKPAATRSEPTNPVELAISICTRWNKAETIKELFAVGKLSEDEKAILGEDRMEDLRTAFVAKATALGWKGPLPMVGAIRRPAGDGA